MNEDGTDQHRLETVPDNSFGPTWSPDGTQIAFLTFESFTGNTKMHNMDLVGLPVLDVKIVDVSTGSIRDLGIRVITDLNRVSWFPTGDTLLIPRVKE